MISGPLAVLILAFPGTSFVTATFPPTATSVTRSWTCRCPYATETLAFQPGGACVQPIAFDSGRAINNGGQWTFRPSSDEVQLTNVTVVDNAFKRPAVKLEPASAPWFLTVRRSVTGSVYLVANEDVDLYFK